MLDEILIKEFSFGDTLANYFISSHVRKHTRLSLSSVGVHVGATFKFYIFKIFPECLGVFKLYLGCC